MLCHIIHVCCRYAERERELLLIEKRLQGAEAQVNDLQARLNDAVIQRKQWETQCNVGSALCGTLCNIGSALCGRHSAMYVY